MMMMQDQPSSNIKPILRRRERKNSSPKQILKKFTKKEIAETEASFHSTGIKQEPKELQLNGKGQDESLNIALQFYKRSPENVIHSLKVKNLSQLQAFPFLTEEMEVSQKDEIGCTRYVNVSSIDAGALGVLLESSGATTTRFPRCLKLIATTPSRSSTRGLAAFST